jgi:hypothetical protein
MTYESANTVDRETFESVRRRWDGKTECTKITKLTPTGTLMLKEEGFGNDWQIWKCYISGTYRKTVKRISTGCTFRCDLHEPHRELSTKAEQGCTSGIARDAGTTTYIDPHGCIDAHVQLAPSQPLTPTCQGGQRGWGGLIAPSHPRHQRPHGDRIFGILWFLHSTVVPSIGLSSATSDNPTSHVMR